MHEPPPPRIYGIFAREAPVGVVFRRGPSAWVELIRLDLANDRAERGAWFHGRVYEDRSDLSPDGDLLVYVAAKHANTDASYGYVWTAVSRPPWMTALALWPKNDTYYGGGLFEGPRDLWLDVAYGEPVAHPRHPEGPLTVRVDWRDEMLEAQRLARDGWTTVSASPLAKEALKRVPRDGLVRERPTGAAGTVLRCTAPRYGEPAYALVRDGDVQPLPGVTWAEVDPGRGLVLERDGRLLRMDARGREVREIADLAADRPDPRPAPDWARQWPHARRTGRRRRSSVPGGRVSGGRT